MAIALMLSMARKVPFINQLTKSGRWRNDLVTRTLFHSTLGIIGMGAIGSLVADIARHGFDMNILYANPTVKPPVEQRTGAKRVSLEELVRVSDVISLHCPLTPETTNLIDDSQFRLMHPHALLINTARPHLVDPAALAVALNTRRIAGCAMDGYYIEPAPSPQADPYGLLLLSDEVFAVTSHLAYLTEDSIQKMCELAAWSVINVLEGQGRAMPMVNPEALHRKSVDKPG
jgi:lactate dehydrogenase-like 2-hydroxyacid dehydrogenase